MKGSGFFQWICVCKDDGGNYVQTTRRRYPNTPEGREEASKRIEAAAELRRPMTVLVPGVPLDEEGYPIGGPHLVKYKCGCVGFMPDRNGSTIVVLACDDEGRPKIHIGTRSPCADKGYEPWTGEPNGLKQPEGFLYDLQQLVQDGYKWRRFKEDLDS